MQFSNWITEFQTLIVGIFGFAGLIITLWFNGKVARHQRWWERKMEAYEKVIEALHNSKMFSEQHLEADIRGKEVPKEKGEELRRRAKLAHDEIEKVIDTGTFLLSENAMTRLRQYRKEADRATDATMWVEYLEADLDTTDKCLKDIIEIAKSDLKTK